MTFRSHRKLDTHTFRSHRKLDAHTSRRHRKLGVYGSALAGALALSSLLSVAQATPRPLPFSYPYETLPQNKTELEPVLDMIPVRVARENPDGTQEGVVSLRSELQTEIEYGITDRLELGWYFVFRQGASADTPFLRFQGIKQRLRLRFAEADEWPVNVGVYFEVAEFHDEIEIEEKILLARRFGALNLVANLWVEQEYYFQTEETKFIYNPTLGGSYELSPNVMVGAEYWARGRFDSSKPAAGASSDAETSNSPHHYAGPTLLLQQGTGWLSVGTYLRLDDLEKSAVVGDPFGKVWIRTMLGLEL